MKKMGKKLFSKFVTPMNVLIFVFFLCGHKTAIVSKNLNKKTQLRDIKTSKTWLHPISVPTSTCCLCNIKSSRLQNLKLSYFGAKKIILALNWIKIELKVKKIEKKMK